MPCVQGRGYSGTSGKDSDLAPPSACGLPGRRRYADPAVGSRAIPRRLVAGSSSGSSPLHRWVLPTRMPYPRWQLYRHA